MLAGRQADLNYTSIMIEISKIGQFSKTFFNER
jgi:hypothetical protein